MERLEIQSDVKPFTMIKNAIIDSENILNEHEKIMYIVLLRYGNKAFPSLSTLSKKCGFSKSTAQRTIDALIEKGLLKKKNRMSKGNGNTSNVYTLIDNDQIWYSSKENLKENIDAAILEEAVKIVEASGMKVSVKENGLETEPTKAQNQAPTNLLITNEKDNTNGGKSQEERYTLGHIHQLFEYRAMVSDNPEQKQDIDSIMDILYTALNTTKETIRISGEDKPTMAVIGKLMKLGHFEIMYCIEKYSEQTGRIRSPAAYMLAMLYGAREQMHFDIKNQVKHDMAHWDGQG